jgi:hypothetical protein
MTPRKFQQPTATNLPLGTPKYDRKGSQKRTKAGKKLNEAKR